MNKKNAMSRIATIEKEAAELRKLIEAPEESTIGVFAVGTFGRFRDSLGTWLFGYLGKSARDEFYGEYGRYDSSELIGSGWGYKHFEPITTAILPQKIKHDGGKCSVNADDMVLFTFQDGSEDCGKARDFSWVWSDDEYTKWGHDIIEYQIIKRAES